MLKKEIKSLFKAVRSGDVDLVTSHIAEKPELVNACNFAPPKKDDGQSPLQVAFKTGNFEFAELLITNGANVNFIEASVINEWTAPVIHDCIRAVVFNSHTLCKDTERFEEGMKLLKMLIQHGAKVDSEDSYGNNCLHRLILDAKQMIDHQNSELKNGILLSQLRQVFSLLLHYGVDIEKETSRRPSPSAVMTNFKLDQHGLV